MQIEDHIRVLFGQVRNREGNLPAPQSMKDILMPLAPRRGNSSININNNVVKLFATSSVEMWLRSVHSFMISASLTDSSKLWASVSGYYASHYAIRAIAHMLGFFHLRRRGYIVQLQFPKAGGFACDFTEGSGENRREHTFYWKRVKQHYAFSSDDLFTENPEDHDESDVAHRNYANYIDHLDNFQTFRPLDIKEITERIEFISKMQISTFEIPNRKKYPDLEPVQIVAYHRILRYRELLNEVLGDSNRFWTVHRTPSWCDGILNFQRVKPNPLPNA